MEVSLGSLHLLNFNCGWLCHRIRIESYLSPVGGHEPFRRKQSRGAVTNLLVKARSNVEWLMTGVYLSKILVKLTHQCVESNDWLQREK